jgi:predicted transcriptional regulator
LPAEASLRRRPDKTFNLRGGLQAEVMAALWKLGEAKVEDVRNLQPRSRRSAYTTLQTVMNRLVEHGLLIRERRGNAFYYRAKYDEADYVARTISERLASASPDARREALIHLVGDLEPSELNELTRYAGQIKRKRKEGRQS